MLTNLTHARLHAVAIRPHGLPPSECPIALEHLPRPLGAEDGFELFRCPACQVLMPTQSDLGQQVRLLNQYPTPKATLAQRGE